MSTAGCVAAQCPLCGGNPTAHGKNELGAGAGIFRKGRLSVGEDRRDRDQARHGGPDVSLLHVGEAADFEAARRLSEEDGRGLHAAEISRHIHGAGLSANYGGAEDDDG